jgi:hypothetical protein
MKEPIMSRLIQLEVNKTYKSRENAIAAVEKKIPKDSLPQLRYVIMTHMDGRFFPAFIGAEAIHAGIHFHFHVIG